MRIRSRSGFKTNEPRSKKALDPRVNLLKCSWRKDCTIIRQFQWMKTKILFFSYLSYPLNCCDIQRNSWQDLLFDELLRSNLKWYLWRCNKFVLTCCLRFKTKKFFSYSNQVLFPSPPTEAQSYPTSMIDSWSSYLIVTYKCCTKLFIKSNEVALLYQ